jgi:hypothetical protein
MRAMPAKMNNLNEIIRNRNKPEEVFRFDKRNRTGLSGGFWAHYRVFSIAGNYVDLRPFKPFLIEMKVLKIFFSPCSDRLRPTVCIVVQRDSW